VPDPPEALDLDAYPDKDLRKQAEKEARRAQKSYEQALKNRDRAIKERQRLLDKQRKKSAKETEKQAKAEEKKRKQEEAALRKAAGDEQKPPPLAQGGRTATGSSSRQEALRSRGHSVASHHDADELARALQRQVTETTQASSASGAGGVSLGTVATSAPSSPGAAAAGGPDAAKPAKKPRDRKFITLPRRVAVDPTWVEVRMEGVDEVGAHCGLFFAGPRYEVLVHDVGERIVGWVHDDASRRAVLALRDEYER